MKDCDLCGKGTDELWEAGSHLVCGDCKKMLENHIGQKCLSCGAWGFIEKTPKNLERVLFWFNNVTVGQVMANAFVMVYDQCPQCGGTKKVQDAIESVLHGRTIQ